MTDISRRTLYGKLNRLLMHALESATAFCKGRGNPYVELGHWLHQILQGQDSDLHRLARHYQLDLARIRSDLLAGLDSLPCGASAVTDFSSFIDEAVERGWIYSSLLYEQAQIRSGFLLAGLLKAPNLRQLLYAGSAEWRKLSADLVLEQLLEIIEGSPEGRGSVVVETAAGEAHASGDSALARYGTNLTARARAGEIDPVIGRTAEIHQIVDILLRRRQNNPLLTGEAGVGKTAVVEGLALRIATGDVPPPLRDIQLWSLDIGSLQSGAGGKGEFEQRLHKVVHEVEGASHPIVLFIDEVHTLVGAGNAGTNDAANLLKPALARGRLRTVGATTWSEYKKYIEKDAALSRRFQVIQVDEPSEAQAVDMLRGLCSRFEQHHQVLLLDDAVEAAVRLAHRYMPARQLPDKAISLLDTACARVALGQQAIPPALDNAQHRLQALQLEWRVAERERSIRVGSPARPAAIAHELELMKTEVGRLQASWQDELALVRQIIAKRAALQAAGEPVLVASAGGARAAGANDAKALVTELDELTAALRDLQGEAGLVAAAVDADAVAAVLSEWTGIPVRRMVKDEARTVLALADTLGQRVIGQPHAMEIIAQGILIARAGLDYRDKPVGCYLLCGPSGVGKTESALALAESLYGGEQNLISLNMSEFQEPHTVASLRGSPPGYVGYGEGGVLTEAVRRRPYSVVLLDEVEKAHPDVLEVFFQVFDKGWMEDGEGRRIDFKNTIIMLTSNVGTELITEQYRDRKGPLSEVEHALRPVLLESFPAAFLGRLTVVPYYPLSDATLRRIVEMQLQRIARRMDEAHGIHLRFDERVIDLVQRRCIAQESGGRMIEAILKRSMLPAISQKIIAAMVDGAPLRSVELDVVDDELTYRFMPAAALVAA